MTQTEIKAKIADWESRLKNPSVASVPSAVAKINSIIDDLKSKLEKDESIVTDKATIQKIKNSINEGELTLKSGKIHGRKMSESELDAVLDSVNKERAKIGMPKFEKPKEKASKKEKKAKAEAEEKSEPKESKKESYDCDDLIKEAKERHEKAKKAAEARAEAPKKTEATKDKEKIEKVYDNVEKHIEKNKLSKAQLEKLIAETKDLLKLLEKALKNL